MDIVLLIGGLLLILVGANALTDGAASVAKRFNISSLVIGLTIVAFGTSAPELTVSVVSALKGSSDIAIGNVVGSNIFNALMIVGRYRTDQRHERYVEQRDPSLRACLNRIIYLRE
jgi:cation:H+ antiporter